MKFPKRAYSISDTDFLQKLSRYQQAEAALVEQLTTMFVAAKWQDSLPNWSKCRSVNVKDGARSLMGSVLNALAGSLCLHNESPLEVAKVRYEVPNFGPYESFRSSNRITLVAYARPTDSSNPLPGEAPAGASAVFDEAYERFKRCVKWEQLARQRFLDDYKFAQADCYNGYQWPNDLRRTREIDERPSLTLNGIRQHNLQIINDAKQNKPSIKAMPTGGGSTYESALCVSAIFKHIEYISNATTAYDLATAFQVQAGWGYIRVETDYCNEDNFDQEIYIRRVTDPLSVYMDPDAKEADKSDARFAFAFEDIDREEFDKSPKWSKWSSLATQTALGDIEGWQTQTSVRVADYWRVVEEKDELFALPKGFGGGQFPGGFVKRSTLKQGGNKFWREIRKALDTNPDVRSRELDHE